MSSADNSKLSYCTYVTRAHTPLGSTASKIVVTPSLIASDDSICPFAYASRSFWSIRLTTVNPLERVCLRYSARGRLIVLAGVAKRPAQARARAGADLPTPARSL